MRAETSPVLREKLMDFRLSCFMGAGELQAEKARGRWICRSSGSESWVRDTDLAAMSPQTVTGALRAGDR